MSLTLWRAETVPDIRPQMAMSRDGYGYCYLWRHNVVAIVELE